MVGTSRYSVVDAAEHVFVEYESLPVVVDPEAALEDGAPLIHEDFGTNKSYTFSLGGGDLDAGFAEADVIIERRIVNHRTAGAPIEPRGAIAEWRNDHMTLWSATQIPHILRLVFAGMFGIPEERLRVVAPEVGGGFGAKLQVTPEEAIVMWCARKLGVPVKWTETRSENMATAHHGRDQIDYARMGAKKDGTVTALDVRIVADMGAYLTLLTPFIPCFSAFVMNGCYKFPAVNTTINGVFTNKMATDAIRGAGRPEATHLLEVMMDQLAAELGLDPLDVRRTNFIPTESFPNADVAVGITYDSGDYFGSLDEAPGEPRPRRLPARSRRSCASRASTAGSASPPGWRSAASHPRAWWAPAASACSPAAGSPRSCGCTRRARPPSTPGPRRTARATRRASPRSWPTGSASRPTRSR